MLLSTIALVCLSQSGVKHGFSLRETTKPYDPIFQTMPGGEGDSKEILANGKATGLIVSYAMKVETKGLDKLGRPIGQVSGSFSGAYSASISLLILPTKAGYRLAQPIKGIPCAFIKSKDRNGRYVGIAYHYFPASFDDPYSRLATVSCYRTQA